MFATLVIVLPSISGKNSADHDAPEKLIYPLERAYTPAELEFATLKGPDGAAAAVLAAAARQSHTELHLALLTVEESGIAEYTGYEPRRGRWSEPELEAGEVDDRSVRLPYLADLTERWTVSSEGLRSGLWEQAHDLSGHMLSDWPADA
jgi:hypothetical protein